MGELDQASIACEAIKTFKKNVQKSEKNSWIALLLYKCIIPAVTFRLEMEKK